MAEVDAFAVEVDGTLEIEVLPDKSLLEKPLHFKTTSTGITVGEDVKDYPYVPPNWYWNTTEQSHVSDNDWKHMEVKTRTVEVRKMRVGVHLTTQKLPEGWSR